MWAVCEVFDFHGREDTNRGLLVCDAVWCLIGYQRFGGPSCPVSYSMPICMSFPSAIHFTPKMETARSSESPVSYRNTTEDLDLDV
jgi:hypothetical protein